MDIDTEEDIKFFKRLRSATPQELRQMEQEVNPYEKPLLTPAEMKRFRELMEFIAHRAVSKVFDNLPVEKRYGFWRSNVEDSCYHAINVAVKDSLEMLFNVKEIKSSIKEASARASEILEDARAVARDIKKRIVKETRDALAVDLKITRGRRIRLKMQNAMIDRKIASWGSELKARSIMAEQLKKAEKRLFDLRQACMKEENGLRLRNEGVVYPDVMAVIYPAPPQPTVPPTLTGEGLPEQPGIYFLWREGVIEYAGLSVRLNERVRLKGHHILRPEHGISFVQVDKRDLTWAECWYIGALRPQLNFGQRAYHYSP